MEAVKLLELISSHKQLIVHKRFSTAINNGQSWDMLPLPNGAGETSGGPPAEAIFNVLWEKTLVASSGFLQALWKSYVCQGMVGVRNGESLLLAQGASPPPYSFPLSPGIYCLLCMQRQLCQLCKTAFLLFCFRPDKLSLYPCLMAGKSQDFTKYFQFRSSLLSLQFFQALSCWQAKCHKYLAWKGRNPA